MRQSISQGVHAVSTMLKSLDIASFRAFERLRIERLGRVNLIVGKNGVGKTTLLEALRFYGMGSGLALSEYLATQHEMLTNPSTGQPILDSRALFHGRGAAADPITIGPIADDSLRLTVRLANALRAEQRFSGFAYEPIEPDDLARDPAKRADVVKAWVIERGKYRVLVSPEPSRRVVLRSRYFGPAYLPAHGVPESDLTYWWDSVSLTRAEGRVRDALRTIAPVEDIGAVADPAAEQPGARLFRARLQGQECPIPLTSLGDGLVRLFQIALALEYARLADRETEPNLLDNPGETPWHQRFRFLLIDEIENGIHYSVLPHLWKWIFQIAELNDLQVFATTHSWDCIRGFQQSAASETENEGALIRLEAGRGQSRAVVFAESELGIVTREQIEVR